ncbi:MAG: S41 family peptidase [Thermoanaerobaculum sp.]
MSKKQRTWFLAASLTLVIGLGTVGALTGKVGGERYKVVGLFSQVVSLVRSSYVEEVPVQKLEEGAIAGLVGSADPQGTWVPETYARDFANYQKRPLPPFGLVLGTRSSYPVVLQVLPGSAAADAGLQPGELFERIGGQPVRARPLWRAVAVLEAAEREGKSLAADVIARDLSGKRPVTLQPGKAGDPSPQVTRQEGAAVVRLPAITQMHAARLATLLPAADTPVVLDLRGTALGTPEGAVEAAAVLAGGEFKLELLAKTGPPLVVRGSKPSTGRRVVVCLDHTTSRAAEWLAFLLSQRGFPTVGVETFGDTGVRESLPAADGELWVARYFLMGHEQKPLLGRGLKPVTLVRPFGEGDPILQKALELARGEEKAKAA